MFSKKYTIFVLFVFLLFIWSFTVVCAENTENTTVTDVDSELISVNMEINSSNEQLNDDFLQSNFNINNVSTIDTSKDRKSTRLNSSHRLESRMPSSA